MAKLFLSYSRKDAAKAQRLCEWLEREGHEVWRDEDDISGGASFSAAIENALKDCDAVVVLWLALDQPIDGQTGRPGPTRHGPPGPASKPCRA